MGSLRLDLKWNHHLCNHDLSHKLISQASLPTHERSVADLMLPASLPLWLPLPLHAFMISIHRSFLGFETRPAFLRPP